MERTMKKIVTFFSLLLLLACLLTGCAMNFTSPVRPPHGILFSQYSAPLTKNLDNTITGTKLTKVSQSSTHYFRDIIFTGLDISWGDASIDTIARMGGLKQVYFADYELLNVLGIYAQYTINVYGPAE
jgi:hypothetical protein